MYVIAKEKNITYGGWRDVEVDEVDVGKFNVVLHSDGARAYAMEFPGIKHCNVVHKKKRQVVNGKAVWVRPHYTKNYVIDIPEQGKVTVKSGKQITTDSG
ncbi:unnamed protein product, partial [Symbiodinium necroappetens]